MTKRTIEVEDTPAEVVEPVDVPAHKRRGRSRKTETPEVVEVVEPANIQETDVCEIPEPVSESPAVVIADMIGAEFRHNGDLPTIVEYVNRSGRTAYLLVDVGEPTLRGAWDVYNRIVTNPSPDEFLSMVNSAVDGARLFTGVARLTL